MTATVTDADRLHCLNTVRMRFRWLSDAACEDAVQAGLLRAWERRARFDGRCAWRSWLIRLCLNAAVDQWRRRQHDGVGSVPVPDGPLAPRQDAALLLSELPVSALLVGRMRGESYAEIAAAHGLRVGTVKSRVSRQRKALRALTGGLQ